MEKRFAASIPLQDSCLWEQLGERTRLLSFDLELTARCNNNCRHCYINLPAADRSAKDQELPLRDLMSIADEAASLGALSCLLTGGEPLLREDFVELYRYLKGKGFLVSVFTNATVVTEEHIRLFRKFPPRMIEVTVYGVTEETYAAVTRNRSSFVSFQQNIDRLQRSGMYVKLKAAALRSNLHELPAIFQFCRERTSGQFRFDPFLHLRIDGDEERNAEIRSERLSADEIVNLERNDGIRFEELLKKRDDLIMPEYSDRACAHLFYCGAGTKSFVISHNGVFRLCSSLCHPECVYDLTRGSLRDALESFVPAVRAMTSTHHEYVKQCRICPLLNLCMWCPAHAHLETGQLDRPIDYFCEIAHARAAALNKE